MASLRSILLDHASTLVPIYRGTLGVASTVMIGSSIYAFFDPADIASQVGLPIHKPSLSSASTEGSAQSEKPATVIPLAPTSALSASGGSGGAGAQSEAEAVAFHAQGWPLLHAGRSMSLGLSMLLLNLTGQMKALSIVSACMYFAGAADTVATRRYGTKDSWKKHWYPTVAFSWLGPLGLLLFW